MYVAYENHTLRGVQPSVFGLHLLLVLRKWIWLGTIL